LSTERLNAVGNFSCLSILRKAPPLVQYALLEDVAFNDESRERRDDAPASF
jgi:hypothetical protein